jgi:hypothetical protein
MRRLPGSDLSLAAPGNDSDNLPARLIHGIFDIALALIKETIVHNFQYFIPPHPGFPLHIKEGGA